MAPFPAQIGIVRHPPKMARLTDAAGPDGPWTGRPMVRSTLRHRTVAGPRTRVEPVSNPCREQPCR